MAKLHKKEKGEETEKLREKVIRALEFPEDLVYPRIVMSGNREISIENYKGIIEYENDLLRVNTSVFIIKIEGKNLEIKNINDDELVVNGTVKNIEYIY